MASTETSPTRVLFFVHIPKTAGTTLATVLARNEPAPRNRALHNVFKGHGGVNPRLIERLRRDRGIDLGDVRLISGHVPLGISEYLPRSLPEGRQLECITLLRDPVDRTLSHFFQIRERGRERGRLRGLAPLAPAATLDDAIVGGYVLDNLQTRMLCGLAEPFGDVDREMLERAKANLRDELVFFGLSERFDESLVLAGRRLRLDTILYRTSERVNASRPRGEEIEPGLIESARRCNGYDIELYEYAQELFERAPERKELDFRVELAAFAAAKARGPITVNGSEPPPDFGGDAQAWRTLLGARAKVLLKDFKHANKAIRHAKRAASDG